MAVLGSGEIRRRLIRGEVFKDGTWDPKGIMEASYALTIAWDGLVVDGRPYPPGTYYDETQIRIEPGRIAILSTNEILNMPGDLSGKIGVRLDFAALGLLGLMGIQIDPYYGQESEHERLYIRVANVSNETIRIQPSDRVFNIELHHAVGAKKPDPPKEDGWSRMQNLIRNQRDASWTYITRVEHDVKEIEERFQPLVLFGVILVAVTILGVMSAVVISTESESVPEWVSGWGWIVLVATFAAGGIATAALVGAEAWRRGVRALAETARLVSKVAWSIGGPFGRLFRH